MDGALIDMTSPFSVKSVRRRGNLDSREILASPSRFSRVRHYPRAEMTGFKEPESLSSEDRLNPRGVLRGELEELPIRGGAMISLHQGFP